MSNKCTNIINPLRVEREGNDQKGRIKNALLPESCPVDARTEKDDLVFIKNFARKIKYYDVNNNLDINKKSYDAGNWGQFFDTDLTIVLANIASEKNDNFKGWIQSEIEKIKDDATILANKKQYFTNLFRYAINLAWQIDVIYQIMPEGFPYKIFLQNLIIRLSPFFKKLVEYYKGADLLSLIDETGIIEAKVFGEEIGEVKQIILRNFTISWNFDEVNFPETPDNSIFGTSGTDEKKLYLGVTHNFFTDILNRFLQAYNRTIEEATTHFEKMFLVPNHEPHITLLLAYVKLFQYSRQHLNGLSARHLDLYYRDILKLAEKAPQPNQVHVNFELAKHIDKFLLSKNTLLKAGKNSQGQDVFYKTNNDLTISHAKITSLRSFYRANQQDDNIKNNGFVYKNRLFAAENLTENETVNFHPFAQKVYIDGKLDIISTPKATLGFAIASNHFFMREGNRTITLTMTCTNLPTTLPANFKDHFTIELTAEKGWIKPTNITSINVSGNLLVFIFSLDPKAPSVLPYNPKTHFGQFNTTFPIVRISLQHIDDEEFIYGLLENTFINNVQISTTVNGVKNLYIQNDFGVLDASKPFLPFGAIPITNQSAFILGSNELFQKKLSTLTLNWDWKDSAHIGDSNPDYILRNGAWTSYIMPITDSDISEPTYGDNPFFSTQSTEGFIKLIYTGNFQDAYNQYLADITNALKTTTATKPTTSSPNPPIANTLTLNYTTVTDYNIDLDTDFSNRIVSFFHLNPFGCAEKHHFLTASTTPLLPQFQRTNTNDNFFVLKDSAGNAITEDIEHEGEFYIGINDLKLPGTISILFQIEDGSSNPQIDKPDLHVHWSFLTQKGWQSFLKNQVFDDTLQLTKSGVISFNISEEATIENTQMPLGKIWIKASVSEANEAICRIIGVHAHAVLTTLKEAEFHADLLEKPLLKSTIAKLAFPEIAVKKVIQNYDSFGGRPQELSPLFYRRVSERLRHKDRAVAVWDYENLILEAFPAIYKVKCLNHTRYESVPSGEIYNELSPQHVTIVTLPNQRNKNQFDPLKPYTSVDILREIDVFLKKRASAFVKLHIRNPIFEEIKIACKVKFFPQFDASLQASILQNEITQFLSPWAFDLGKDIVFGGILEKSVVINFIEERPYVDYLTEMKLYHKHDGIEEEVETAKATKGIAILVSTPAIQHIIDIIPASADNVDLESCRC